MIELRYLNGAGHLVRYAGKALTLAADGLITIDAGRAFELPRLQWSASEERVTVIPSQDQNGQRDEPSKIELHVDAGFALELSSRGRMLGLASVYHFFVNVERGGFAVQADDDKGELVLLHEGAFLTADDRKFETLRFLPLKAAWTLPLDGRRGRASSLAS